MWLWNDTPSSAPAPTGKPKSSGVKKKKTAGKHQSAEDSKRVLIVEKVIDGVNMKELLGIVDELKGLKKEMAARAAVETVDEEEELSKLSLKEKIIKKIERQIDENAPVGDRLKKKLPISVVGSYWALGKILTIVLIIYFTYSTFNTDQTTKNISLDPTTSQTDSTSNFRKCLSVPNAITSQFHMDKSGYWEGATKYTPGVSVYNFVFNAFQKSLDDYSTYMKTIKSDLAALGNSSKYSPIWNNLARATSYVDLIEDGTNTHKVYLAGDPSFIFNRFYKSATIASSSLNCYAIPEILFDRNSGAFSIRYSYGSQTKCTSGSPCICTLGNGYISGSGSYSGCTSYQTSSGTMLTTSQIQQSGCCPVASSTSDTTTQCVIIPNDAGYKSKYDSQYFTLKYNIRTLVTAYAINQGILSLSALTPIDSVVEQSYRGCYSLYGESDCATAINTNNATCGNSYVGLAYDNANKKCSIKVKGTKYNIRAYMDPQYSGMEPVYCLIDATKDSDGDDDGASSSTKALVCLLRLGSAYVYPFIGHMGGSDAAGDPYNWGYGCHCSKPKFPSSYSSFYDSTFYSSKANGLYPGQYGHSVYSYCNQFDLMHGFIMFKGKHYDAHFYLNAVMAKLYSAEELTNMAQVAGFTGLRVGGNAGAGGNNLCSSLTTCTKTSSDLTTKMISGSTNAYSFCGFATGVSDDMGSTTAQCSVFAMQTVDSLDERVSAEGVNDNQLSCNDFVTVPDASWDDGNGGGTVNTPPTQLIQDYYECYNTIQTSIIAAFGSAAGLAGAVAPIALTVFVMLTSSGFIKKPDPIGEKQQEQQQLQQQQQQQQKQKQKHENHFIAPDVVTPTEKKPGMFARMFSRGPKSKADVTASESHVSIEMTAPAEEEWEVQDAEEEYEEVEDVEEK